MIQILHVYKKKPELRNHNETEKKKMFIIKTNNENEYMYIF